MTERRSSPGKERTPEMETLALLRRLKRQGVKQVEWDSEGAGVRLRAAVQVGRAHSRLETAEHDTQYDALVELSTLVADVAPGRGRRRGKPAARRLERPRVEPAVVDDTPLGTVEEVMRRRDTATPARRAALERQEQHERERQARAAARAAERGADRSNRRGGR